MRKKRDAPTVAQNNCPMHHWQKHFLSEERCTYCDLRWSTWAKMHIKQIEGELERLQKIVDDALEVDLIFTVAGLAPNVRAAIMRAGGKVHYDKNRYVVYPPLGSTFESSGRLILPNNVALYLLGDFTHQHDGSQLILVKP